MYHPQGQHYLQGIRNSESPEVRAKEEQVLSDSERREVLNLVKENNISMDFILEMKEAFLLFDKVSNSCKSQCFEVVAVAETRAHK